MPDLSQMADIELNGLVAEKVMGDAMPPVPEDIRTAEDLELCDSPLESPGKCWKFSVPYRGTAQWLPRNFAGDIAQAWRVVGRMRERGWGFAFEWNKEGPYSDVRMITDPKAHFNGHTSPFVTGAIEDSAPRAICIAALKVVAEAPRSA